MMQDYLDIDGEGQLRDPDALGAYSLDELKSLVRCLHERNPVAYTRHRDDLKRILAERVATNRDVSELVVVPTASLYIEALVGTHPLLEDFKLIHRALDVKKVQAEVRRAELENIRLAARALKGNDEDPDIEKKIVIETATQNLTIQPDGN
jgi:hypothetical protein